MKLILDCNVIISAGLTDGICRKVLWEAMQNHTLYVSEPMLLEYREVISRPKFSSAKNYLYSLMRTICELSELIDPKHTEISLPDQSDLIYINTALACGADYLITGNLKDFPEKQYGETIIVSPKDFLRTDKVGLDD